MNHADYPRVAVVSCNPIRGDQCNGIMMKSLFAQWPRERLSQIYFPTIVTWEPDHDVCGDYRAIMPWGRVKRIQPRKLASATSPAPVWGSGGLVRRTVSKITAQRRLMDWLRPCAELWSATIPLSRVLARQLREIQPDCVYALLGNYHLTKTVCLACSRLGLPLFTHVTDDFITAQYANMRFASALQRLSDQWFRRTVNYSSGLAAVSPLMAEEFGVRYGKEWSWFTTGVESHAYDPSPRVEDGTIRLVYSGNIELERWQTLRSLAHALKLISEAEGKKISLAIYAPQSQLQVHKSALNVAPVVELCGWKRPEELPALFHQSDILVHVESFDPKIIEYTRLSFSTKLTQYMMAGRSILAVGPQEAGSLRMLKRLEIGQVANETDPAALARAIAPLIVERRNQQQLAQRGRDWALKWCERAIAHKRFREQLAKVARLGARAKRARVAA